jgi:hypothetical protein
MAPECCRFRINWDTRSAESLRIHLIPPVSTARTLFSAVYAAWFHPIRHKMEVTPVGLPFRVARTSWTYQSEATPLWLLRFRKLNHLCRIGRLKN